MNRHSTGIASRDSKGAEQRSLASSSEVNLSVVSASPMLLHTVSSYRFPNGIVALTDTALSLPAGRLER